MRSDNTILYVMTNNDSNFTELIATVTNLVPRAIRRKEFVHPWPSTFHYVVFNTPTSVIKIRHFGIIM